MTRSRLTTSMLLLTIIVLGLASRKYTGLFPEMLGKYPGDALWSMAAYFGLAMLLTGRSPLQLSLLALGVSFLVEFSQLYHAPWLDAVRRTTIGHLFLGTTFNTNDLIAYTLGVLMAFVLEACLWRWRVGCGVGGGAR